jgi:Protein of unknown function (DUF2764).
MGQYHHLIAGLPDITLDDSKQAYSVYDFREEVYGVLSRRDKTLLNLFFLKYDNLNLLRWLDNKEAELDERGTFSKDDIEALFTTIKEKEIRKEEKRKGKKRAKKEDFEENEEMEKEFEQKEVNKKPKKMPPYFAEFFRRYLERARIENPEETEDSEDSDFTWNAKSLEMENETEKDKSEDLDSSWKAELFESYRDKMQKDDLENPDVAWEDILSALYYAYAMKKGNSFISQWFEMNLNIKNILIAITCRKHSLDKNIYIIGNNNIAKALKASNAKDYNLEEDTQYVSAVFKLAEEPDLVMREKRVDIMKWEWLDYNTIYKIFGIESIFTYLLKTEMIERWVGLDRVAGENTFRELILAMKKESNSTLEEFKKNNKR